MVMSTRKSWCE